MSITEKIAIGIACGTASAAIQLTLTWYVDRIFYARRQRERAARWAREDEAWQQWCTNAYRAIRDGRVVPAWRKP